MMSRSWGGQGGHGGSIEKQKNIFQNAIRDCSGQSTLQKSQVMQLTLQSLMKRQSGERSQKINRQIDILRLRTSIDQVRSINRLPEYQTRNSGNIQLLQVHQKVEKELIYKFALMMLALANESYCDDYKRIVESRLTKYTANMQKGYKTLHKIIEQIINLKPKQKWNLKNIHDKYKHEKIQFEEPKQKSLLQMLSSFQDVQITRLDKLLLVLIQGTEQTDMNFKKLNNQLSQQPYEKGKQKSNKTVDSSQSRLQQINIWKKDYEKQLIFNVEKTQMNNSEEDYCLYETQSQSQHQQQLSRSSKYSKQSTLLSETNGPYLHVFPDLQQKILIFSVGQGDKAKVTNIELNNNFIIPHDHSSYQMQFLGQTLIFLLGGCAEKRFMIYFHKKKQLQSLEDMCASFERKFFGICSNNQKGVLYVGGGERDAKITNQVEKYDLRMRKWSLMSPLNHQVRKNSLVLFNHRYLLSIGGQGKDGQPLQQIEILDLWSEHGQWNIMQFLCQVTTSPLTVAPLSFQINNDQVCILGGHQRPNEYTQKIFTLSLYQFNDPAYQDKSLEFFISFFKFSLEFKNQFKVPHAEMVYHTQFYHSNNALYFLQTPEKLSNFKSIILAKTNDVKEVDKIKIVNYSI